MPEVRILLRGILLVMVVLVFSTCAVQHGGGTGGTGLRNPCGSGRGTADRNAPIVCVDDTGGVLSVHPDPIEAHTVGAADRQPVVLHWWTRSGARKLNLQIEPGCTTSLQCRDGHCTARTLPSATPKQCKYDVWTDKHPRLDPTIVINPCC